MAALLNLNVLLADDDENDLILFRRIFKRLDGIGHLAVVPDGNHVLSYLQAYDPYSDRAAWPFPGLLVLDQGMPRLSGIDVLCWVRTEPRFSKLPVVLLSGGLPPGTAGLLSGLHAAYCVKSVDFKASSIAIEEAIIEALRLTRSQSAREFRNPSLSPHVTFTQEPINFRRSDS